MRKIIWAVDPFAEAVDFQRAVAHAIRAAAKGAATEVEPVFVAGTGYLGTPVPLALGAATEIQKAGQERLRRLLRGLEVPGLKPLRVIAGSHLSARESARTLIGHARRSGATLLAVGTHAKKGPKRWVLGSFAETLVLHCDIPVLAVNPLWKRAGAFERVLFPTDFSAESRQAYTRIIALAKRLGSEVELYHRFNYGTAPVFGYSYQEYGVYDELYKAALADRRTDAESWADEGRKAGVKVRVVVDARSTEAVAKAVVRRARKGVGLIAMASHSGPLAAVFPGSATRAVLRASPVPVWVVHPGRASSAPARASSEEAPLYTVTSDETERKLPRADRAA